MSDRVRRGYYAPKLAIIACSAERLAGISLRGKCRIMCLREGTNFSLLVVRSVLIALSDAV